MRMRASIGGERTAAALASAGRGLAVLAFSLAAQTTGADAAVFGRDDRVSLPGEHAGLAERIGVLVDARSKLVCTAFCAGESTIGTAAHCVFGSGGGTSPRLEDLSFRLGMGAAAPQTGIAGARSGRGGHSVLAGSSQPRMRPPIGATSDWAFVRLETALCRAGGLRVNPLPAEKVREAAEQGRVYQIGFHRDFKDWQLAHSGPCPVGAAFGNATTAAAIAREFSQPEQLLLHRCATGGASSGAPLLIDGASGPEVIGISVGTYVRTRVRLQGGEVVERLGSDTVANTGVGAAAFAEALEAFLGAGNAGTVVAKGPLKAKRPPVVETGSTR